MTVKDSARRLVEAARGVCAPVYLCGWCPDYSTRDKVAWDAHHTEHDLESPEFAGHVNQAIEVSR